jgi:hypothetical protein
MCKFIQLIATNIEDEPWDTILALDDNGMVWQRTYLYDNEKKTGRWVWHKWPFYIHPESV